MPQNLILTQPDAVMPSGLMVSFTEELERPALMEGEWSGGETARFALTALARRVFRVTRKLRASDADALTTFLLEHESRPFWFYNLRETTPVGSWDPTGQNPVGRYAVVWQGGFTDARAPGARASVLSFELREVEV